MIRIDTSHNPVAIGRRFGACYHWRHQIWHDDGAGKMARRIINYRAKHSPITKMKMPIIRTADGHLGHNKDSHKLLWLQN